MTYSTDLRKQVLKSIDEGMSFKKASKFYNISPTSIQNWKTPLEPKATKDYQSYKINDQALIKDVEDHPDDYQYDRAKRFACTASAICTAMKKLNLTRKKSLESPQSLSNQKTRI